MSTVLNVVWWFVLSVLWVAGVALMSYGVFALATRSKRKGLKDAWEQEFAEIRTQEGYSAPSFLGGHRRRTPEKEYDYMRTESGKRLLELERTGEWVTVIGVLLALIALVIYWRVN